MHSHSQRRKAAGVLEDLEYGDSECLGYRQKVRSWIDGAPNYSKVSCIACYRLSRASRSQFSPLHLFGRRSVPRPRLRRHAVVLRQHARVVHRTVRRGELDVRRG